MKILDAGRTVVPWWVNQVVSCPHCQRTVQLEGNDFEYPELLVKTDGSLAVFCPNCKSATMHLAAPFATAVPTALPIPHENCFF